MNNVTAHKYQTPSVKHLITALIQVQNDLLSVKIKKDQKKSYQDKKGNWQKLEYASFDSILKVTRPILTKHGLMVTQGLAGDLVDTCINHSSGEQMGYLTNFLAMENAKNNSLQNMGGGFTYLKRYTYSALLGICIEDETDDPKKNKEQPEAPKLPLLSKDQYFDAANLLLKDGSLNSLLEKNRITEQQTGAIYILAKGIKDKSNQEAKEADAANEAQLIEQ